MLGPRRFLLTRALHKRWVRSLKVGSLYKVKNKLVLASSLTVLSPQREKDE